jgi:hypothetical protein
VNDLHYARYGSRNCEAVMPEPDSTIRVIVLHLAVSGQPCFLTFPLCSQVIKLSCAAGNSNFWKSAMSMRALLDPVLSFGQGMPCKAEQ